MTSKELRQKFLNFFEKKGHKIVPSSLLLPSDPSVLFTTAGMQQFSLYLSGKKDVLKDFGNRHLASCQKCFRSDDIEEIGDDTHNTFFEMLGNWSIGIDEKGGYFKESAIRYALEFLENELGLDRNKFFITVFKGNKNISKDNESAIIWQEQGISKERIIEFEEGDNLWGPVGETGPCGPCSEIHYDRGAELGCGRQECGPNCPYCDRYVEIWNLVFMEYNRQRTENSGQRTEEYEYISLPQKNVDTGIGFERVVSILQNKLSAYETDLFLPILQEIQRLSGTEYDKEKKNFRIIADHIRGSVFLISEGVLPSNLGQGYILRRLLRRAMRYGKMLNIGQGFLLPLANKVVEIYKDVYPEILPKQADISAVIQEEEGKFDKALEKGIKETISVMIEGNITGKKAFDLYQTYGFPVEMIEELAREHNRKVDKQGFERALKEHQEISRAGAEKKFGGKGIESAETEGDRVKMTKLHTATHLLHAALRKILGSHVRQMGSNITPERLRFDFSHPQKVSLKELEEIEKLVNEKIKEDLEVQRSEMKYEDAVQSGALAFFKEKYPEVVNVYSIGPSTGSGQVPSDSSGHFFSKEVCAGPHIKKTSELGYFKIIKEESSSGGVRRIKAKLITGD